MQEHNYDKLFHQFSRDTHKRYLDAKALLEGDRRAVGLYILGPMYKNGWGVPQDYNLWYKMYAQAAKLGHAGAAFELARLHIQGNYRRGIESDYDLARDYIHYVTSEKLNKLKDAYNCENYKQSEAFDQLVELDKIIDTLKSMHERKLESGLSNG